MEDDPRYYGFDADDDDGNDGGDDGSYSSNITGYYEATVVRWRKSMQWHRDHLAPGAPLGRGDRDRLHNHHHHYHHHYHYPLQCQRRELQIRVVPPRRNRVHG